MFGVGLSGLEIVAIESLRLRIIGLRLVKKLSLDQNKQVKAGSDSDAEFFTGAGADADAGAGIPLSFGDNCKVGVAQLRVGASISPALDTLRVQLTPSHHLAVERAPSLFACLESNKQSESDAKSTDSKAVDGEAGDAGGDDSNSSGSAAAAAAMAVDQDQGQDQEQDQEKSVPKKENSKEEIELAAANALVAGADAARSTASNPYHPVPAKISVEGAVGPIVREVMDGILFRSVENQNVFDAMATFPDPIKPGHMILWLISCKSRGVNRKTQLPGSGSLQLSTVQTVSALCSTIIEEQKKAGGAPVSAVVAELLSNKPGIKNPEDWTHCFPNVVLITKSSLAAALGPIFGRIAADPDA